MASRAWLPPRALSDVVTTVAPRPNQPCVLPSKVEFSPVVLGGRPGGPDTRVTLKSSMYRTPSLTPVAVLAPTLS